MICAYSDNVDRCLTSRLHSDLHLCLVHVQVAMVIMRLFVSQSNVPRRVIQSMGLLSRNVPDVQLLLGLQHCELQATALIYRRLTSHVVMGDLSACAARFLGAPDSDNLIAGSGHICQGLPRRPHPRLIALEPAHRLPPGDGRRAD